MYATFLDCRGGWPDLGAKLERLEAVLRDPELATAIAPEGYTWMPPPGAPFVVGDANRAIHDVLALAVADMRRLFAGGELTAVRNLGYALHNLPDLLRRPADFRPGEFMFCMRFAAYRWALLSPELRRAFARLLAVTPERLEEIVSAEGFADSQYDP